MTAFAPQSPSVEPSLLGCIVASEAIGPMAAEAEQAPLYSFAGIGKDGTRI